MRQFGMGLAVLALALAGCTPITAPLPSAPPGRSQAADQVDPDIAARNFIDVITRVEPVAESVCRAQTVGLNCDFQIVIDSRPGSPPNAFQTQGPDGRPVVGFTVALIADARNQDELAFVLGHEASHHIAGHLARTQETAMAGAALAGVLATIGGAGPDVVRTAQQYGAGVGARTYSKEFELEADRLGTVIAYRAGYDPAIGAAFFDRIPDPGDAFLGSHPPNAARRAAVRDTLASLR